MTEREIAMRIVVVDPPPDVAFALQRGRAELVAATRSTGAPLAFTFSVRARMGGPKPGLNLLGPFAQGTPDKRFVYVLKNAEHDPHYYVGLTSDVKARLADHNAGRCSHTAARRPWQPHVVIEFSDEARAVGFESYLKSGSGRAFAKRHFEL